MTRSQPFVSRYGPSALVTGGSEGVGLSFARELARRGLNLLLVARRPGPLDAASEEIRKTFGVEVTPLRLDIAEGSDLEELLRQAASRDVGLLVLSAAHSPIGEFLDLPAEEHRRVIDTNCRATALLVHESGKRLVARGRGGMILVSSLAGFQGTAMVAHYAATKAYQRVLAEGLWNELRERGVEVLACCAGLTDTPAYRRSNAKKPGWQAPPPMDSDRVARETLEALGRGPVFIPGRRNRFTSFLTQRTFPKKAVVNLISRATREMYPRNP